MAATLVSSTPWLGWALLPPPTLLILGLALAWVRREFERALADVARGREAEGFHGGVGEAVQSPY